MLFNQLGLSAELLRAVEEQGYTQATPIQSKAIPHILGGHDLLAGAQTGTGKTAGFVLPLLHRMRVKPKGWRNVRALILTPTRELASQVNESVHRYGQYVPVRSMEIYGGVSPRPQIAKINRGVDVVVATPGRLLDHVREGNIDLSHVEYFVLDEADRMLDMGFIRDIRQIIRALPAERQNLLFSATFSDEIRELANRLLHDPLEIQVAARNTSAERVNQIVYPVDKARKRELLSQLIGRGNWQQVLVFTRTKHGANRLATQLEKDGIQAAAIHGGKGQGARTKALREFKAGKTRVLVATDIAARGIDIDRLPHVVNYELPYVPEDYVHRIGRTARAGREGTAVSLVCVDESKLLADIEKLLRRELRKEFVPGFDVDKRIQAEPLRRGGAPRAGGAGRKGKTRRAASPHAGGRGKQSRGQKPRRQRRRG